MRSPQIFRRTATRSDKLAGSPGRRADCRKRSVVAQLIPEQVWKKYLNAFNASTFGASHRFTPMPIMNIIGDVHCYDARVTVKVHGMYRYPPIAPWVSAAKSSTAFSTAS